MDLQEINIDLNHVETILMIFKMLRKSKTIVIYESITTNLNIKYNDEMDCYDVFCNDVNIFIKLIHKWNKMSNVIININNINIKNYWNIEKITIIRQNIILINDMKIQFELDLQNAIYLENIKIIVSSSEYDNFNLICFKNIIEIMPNNIAFVNNVDCNVLKFFDVKNNYSSKNINCKKLIIIAPTNHYEFINNIKNLESLQLNISSSKLLLKINPFKIKQIARAHV